MNGLVVVALPIAVFLVVPFLPEDGRAVSARVSPLYVVMLREAAAYIALLSPFVLLACIAAWRTWVHAGYYVRRHGGGWQGVLEAGGAGLGVALVVLLPSIVRSPTQAPPYVVAYGGAATAVGLACGLLLRMTALRTLKWYSSSTGHF